MPMKKIPFLLLYCCLLLAFDGWGQDIDYHPKGIGLLTPAWYNSEEAYAIPDTVLQLHLYEWPAGNIVAQLRKEKDPENPNLTRSTFVLNGKEQAIDSRFQTFALSGFKDHYLQFYQEYEGYVQIRLNGNAYWLHQKELTQHSFSYQPYLSYLKQLGMGLTPLIGMNINLREAPHAKGEKIVLVKSNDDLVGPHFVLGLLEEAPQGNWARVEVKKYPSWGNYCQGQTSGVVSYQGWMKVLDNAGHPNVWQYSGACD